jgi:phosphopantothenoylcysteine decarboxylase
MSENSKPATIVLGVTGSIAAYKAADLTSRLVKANYEVYVIMTENAKQFVGSVTFQTLSKHPVMSNVFDEKDSWRPGHIELADNADLLLIAPATANTIAKLAHGLADDPIGEVALATLAPMLVAPAMNGKMWMHPATCANVETLKRRGVQFIGPEQGMLACGYTGIGRMWNVEGIVERVEKMLNCNSERNGR